ncbi:MAG: hypothetical protein WAW96_11165 [Alphaproteobacteria bacterium]
MRIILRILSEITGWLCALLVLGYVTGQRLLPHFDPQTAAPGAEPQTTCYGIWIDASSAYATTCRASWLSPIATWVNISSVLITYTLRFLMMALGRDLGGNKLGPFSTGLFEALAVFAVPTLLVLAFGINFWIGIGWRVFGQRRSSVSGRVRG